jgi:hypothetical protein
VRRLGLDASFGDLSHGLSEDGDVKLPPPDETEEMVGGEGGGLWVEEDAEGRWCVNVGTTKQTITFGDCADVLIGVHTNPGESTAKKEKCTIYARHVAQLIHLKHLEILAPDAHTADMKKWLSKVITKEAVKQKVGKDWHGRCWCWGTGWRRKRVLRSEKRGDITTVDIDQHKLRER